MTKQQLFQTRAVTGTGSTSDGAEEQGGRSNRLQNELRKLNTFFNVTVPPPAETAEVALATALTSTYTEPTNFEEAWENPDLQTRKKWREAIIKEINEMVNKQVWQEVKLKDVPKGRKTIGSKWVFKLKKNGTHRARLVALGYSQIPGVDYTENYSPVINDTTLRIILVFYIIFGFDSKIMDVETAFLYGDLDEEIYMKIPKGLDKITRFTYGAGGLREVIKQEEIVDFTYQDTLTDRFAKRLGASMGKSIGINKLGLELR